MSVAPLELILKRLSDLRTELIEVAFVMDQRGRLDAADVAMTASAQIAELREELCAAGNSPTASATVAPSSR